MSMDDFDYRKRIGMLHVVVDQTSCLLLKFADNMSPVHKRAALRVAKYVASTASLKSKFTRQQG